MKFSILITGLVRHGNIPIYEKHELPYDLNDKIQENRIEGNLRVMIEESFDEYYEPIETTLDILSEKELSIRQSFLSVIRCYYLQYLELHNIDLNEEEKIQENAADILNLVKSKVCSVVECSEEEICYNEEIPVFAFALVVYAFYKCRILLKVDGEK